MPGAASNACTVPEKAVLAPLMAILRTPAAAPRRRQAQAAMEAEEQGLGRFAGEPPQAPRGLAKPAFTSGPASHGRRVIRAGLRVRTRALR